jgi:hypothetical protein
MFEPRASSGWLVDNADGFKTNGLLPSSTPEPTGLALAGVALAGLCARGALRTVARYWPNILGGGGAPMGRAPSH